MGVSKIARLSRPFLVLALLLSVLMCYFIVSERRSMSGTSYSEPTMEAWTGSAPSQRLEFSRIFFLETGGHGSLTARIACAVESAARMHPHWTVYLLSAASGDASQANVTFAGPFAQMLRSIPNVVMNVVRPNEVFQETPLESWYESGILNKSAYPVEHLADALRLAVLYKRGGVYLDIDVIVMRSLDSLPPCVSQSPVENGDMVSNGFLAFRRGDPFLLYLMLRAREVYKPEEWNSIGPQLLRRVTLARCGVREVKALLGRRCGGDTGFTVIPHWMFLPVPYDRWQSFFLANASREAWLMSSASYVMHVYNKMSSKAPAVPGSAYRQAAETYCPDSLRLSLQMQDTF
ncbi:lactosylceramide 4-alpha-galactosyltransferase isoform X1 [Dermacentor silvarum]|uniref:lactosylceramide 4-alpha-galactosyltransferase isoform X1 n=1 Tax=Dermacentor silvarum TaxID=543639 RepID=UPI001897784D|nr:lactosylceramide 4-alpha-galactosyltransferase isoform X1 [Dermacentor silvarum]